MGKKIPDPIFWVSLNTCILADDPTCISPGTQPCHTAVFSLTNICFSMKNSGLERQMYMLPKAVSWLKYYSTTSV